MQKAQAGKGGTQRGNFNEKWKLKAKKKKRNTRTFC